jgi:hypothetical protein
MAAMKVPVDKARPFSDKKWKRILAGAASEDVRRFKLWALLGWRKSQFLSVEFAKLRNNPTMISITTPPGKGGGNGTLPATHISCRCALYSHSYKLAVGDLQHTCTACATAMPTWEGGLDLKKLDEHDYSSHSFRRTLALAIKLTIAAFDIKLTTDLAKTINARLQWFEGQSASPAQNYDMLTHYTTDAKEIYLEYLPQIFRSAALELCAPLDSRLIASPNGTLMLM